MNYYYADTVTSTYREWSSMYGDVTGMYLSLMGLDVTKSLEDQPHPDGEGSWADYFMTIALDRAKADYIIYDMAMAEGYTLSAEANLNLDSTVNYKDLYAMTGGYSDVDDYMVAFYGPGASRESYYEYSKVSAIASAYYNDYSDTLTYTDADIRAYEKGKVQDYNSFTYASYYLGYGMYLPEGTTDPSDEMIADAVALAKVDADTLAAATTIEELDAAIAALSVNAGSTSAASTKYPNYLYPSVNSVIRSWVADPARQENDLAVIPNEVTSTDDAGNETTSLNGYYVVIFQSADDNTAPMNNVRHLLIKYEGGTKDEAGNTVYSDAEKAAAKATAEGHLDTWKNGEATEESFMELAAKYSQDSSSQNGGMIADIHPGSPLVPSFLNWSIDPTRAVGDTAVIESEYGYHVMYYSGKAELSYRDQLITNELRENDLDAWYNSIMDGATITEGNLSKVNTDLVLAANA